MGLRASAPIVSELHLLPYGDGNHVSAGVSVAVTLKGLLSFLKAAVEVRYVHVNSDHFIFSLEGIVFRAEPVKFVFGGRQNEDHVQPKGIR